MKRIKADKSTTEEIFKAPSLEELIRQRAYEISMKRGDGLGSDLDDWLQAEAEIQTLNRTRSIEE